MVDTDQYFNNVIKIVLEAGKILSEGFKSPKEISTKKHDRDYVTQFDKLVEKIIIENIIKLYPNHKFIAEESTTNHILTNEPTWIIDPIDGTTNFIQGFPFCCISIALSVENNLIIGIVYNPIINQLFTAQKGKGAYLNNEKIHVSNTKDLKNAMIGFDIHGINNDKFIQYTIKNIDFIVKNCRGSRSLGSAAINLCYLAMGSIDICHFIKLKCWDVTAGILIVQEAGGIVLDSNGGHYKDIMNADIVVACTRQLADNYFLKKPNMH